MGKFRGGGGDLSKSLGSRDAEPKELSAAAEELLAAAADDHGGPATLPQVSNPAEQ